MAKIVILGAGFGGLQTALRLEKKLKNKSNISITLIDKRDYHLFTPNLFEAATTEEELVTEKQTKQALTLPLEKILRGKKIKFVKGNVLGIEPEKKRVLVDNKNVDYDYLVLALGSKTDFYNIEGVEKYALVLKDLPDALRLRNNVAFAMQSHRLDMHKQTIRLVVAGGGYTGVELVGELKGLVDFLAWENNYPREKVEIEVIEANPKLIFGADERLSRDAYIRLEDLNIRIRLSSKVVKVGQHLIELDSGDRLTYDVLVWTAGVKACDCLAQMPVDAKGRIKVNGMCQGENHHNIFALGDIACIMGQNGYPVPATAQDAIDQAKYLAYALPYVMSNQRPPKPYKSIRHGFIVNIGGKWAIFSHHSFYFAGFLAFILDKLAHLRYYLSLMGFWKALKCVIFQTEIYSRND